MSDDIFKILHTTEKKVFDPVKKCIYCGSTDNLSDEHIVPFALNGTMILPKSSCRTCAKITSKFELTVARRMYGLLRYILGYNTRNKKVTPSHLPVSYTTSAGVTESTYLKIEDYPCTYFVPYLPPPGILTGTPLTDKNPEGIRLEFRGDPNEIEQVNLSIDSKISKLHLNSNYPYGNSDFPYGDFNRLLAKIAHGYLVAHCGQEGYVPFLPDIILGRSPYLSHYVGGLSGADIHMFSYHIFLELLPTNEAAYLSVNIQLLGGVRMQTYQVIAAKLI